MTRLYNDPGRFVAEMTEGFVAANKTRVRSVDGGVISLASDPPGRVAVVTGGGSGHYPAFVGYVGPGMARGAVTGNVFASPSARQVYNVAREAELGGGVLLVYGNYAGDTLNFGQAEDRLRAEGVECRTVRVTDDVMSADVAHPERRRGIAGDVFVLKVAGAAAAAGMPLEAVEQVTRRANERCRSVGVAFGGCTLPGATEPLFALSPGQMALGMGIHGEPGLSEQGVVPAHELARILVVSLLADFGPQEAGGDQAAVLLNGLGTVKYDELYVLYGSVEDELRARNISVVDAQVGEFVTSFDMAGVSLSLLWLDHELRELWFAPANAVAFRQGTPDELTVDSTPSNPVAHIQADVEPVARDVSTGQAVATAASRQLAAAAVDALGAAAEAIDRHAEELGRLDAIAGDGDHGLGMQRGVRAALAAAAQAEASGCGLHSTVVSAAMAWADRAGGTSGALWGLGLEAFAGHLSDEVVPTAADLAAAVAASLTAVGRAGGARPGDKTMLDALAPLADRVRTETAAGSSISMAWQAGCVSAANGARQTAGMVPRLGRARTHGERSVGSEDPGAHSLALLVSIVVERLSSGGLLFEEE